VNSAHSVVVNSAHSVGISHLLQEINYVVCTFVENRLKFNSVQNNVNTKQYVKVSDRYFSVSTFCWHGV